MTSAKSLVTPAVATGPGALSAGRFTSRRHHRGLASTHDASSTASHQLSEPTYQAFTLLRVAFTVAPIVFGLDKFLNWMTDWTHYLAPQINDIVPGNAHQAMLAVGVIEIVAGLVVAVRPRWGSYLVAVWLAGIITNLLLIGNYYDVALRDFGLMLAALTLARLSSVFNRPAGRASSDVPSRDNSGAQA